jgi:hypothetical protein
MRTDCNFDADNPRLREICLKLEMATFDVSINNLAEFLSGIEEFEVSPAFRTTAEE